MTGNPIGQAAKADWTGDIRTSGAMRLKRNVLTGVLTFGVIMPCLANPIDPTGQIMFALTVESLLVALLMIPVGLRFLRVFVAWAGITTATWVLLFFAIVSIDRLLPGGVYDGAIIGESCVVLAEAWLLTWLSRRPFFHSSKAKALPGAVPAGFSLKPDVRPLSWWKALLISFFANGVSLILGSMF